MTIEQLIADRIGGASFFKNDTVYKFEKIKRWKKAARENYPDRLLLDFGIGENDDIADESVRERMSKEIHLHENKGYPDNGIFEYKEAAANWLKRNFNVVVDPHKEVLHSIGSKGALSLIPKAFINPGDITIMTIPGYPVLGTHAKYLGGEVHSIPLTHENNFVPNLDEIPEEICKRAKIMCLNYPNSPSGATVGYKFFEKVVAFAKKHNIIIVHDAAHIVLNYNEKPLSFLEVDGAKEVGIETHSMSKGFNMIGWRLGFIAGNEKIVKAVAEIKDNSDSGQFIAIQKAAIQALNTDSIGKKIREKYRTRLQKLVKILSEVGLEASMPGGTYFLYVRVPKGIKNGAQFNNALDMAQFILENDGIVVVPWDDAGSYLRFSATYTAQNEQEEAQLMEALKERLSKYEFVY
jgi:LL-diaminopimelate aminotransferase